MDGSEEPEILGSVDLRGLHVAIAETDGDLVLLVDDGDVQIQFESGLAGSWEQAILGAHRLASVATEFAEALRLRRVGELSHSASDTRRSG